MIGGISDVYVGLVIQTAYIYNVGLINMIKDDDGEILDVCVGLVVQIAYIHNVIRHSRRCLRDDIQTLYLSAMLISQAQICSNDRSKWLTHFLVPFYTNTPLIILTYSIFQPFNHF